MESRRIEGDPGFRALAESAPVGIFELDPEGRCLFVNDHWCAIAGISADEAAGRGWVRVVHPDDVEPMVAEWDEATRTGREFELEYRYVRPDGEEVWVDGRAVAIRDEEGEVVARLGTVVDISARRRAEEELARSEQRYRSTIESVGDVVFRTDPEGHWTLLNAAFTEHTGIPVKRALGSHFSELVEVGDRELVEQAIAPLARRHADSARFSFRYRAAGGTMRWAQAAVRRVDAAAGEAGGFAGTINDITERRQADDAMRMLVALVDFSSDAIIGKDLEGTVTSWNRGAERIFGYGAEEMIGRSIDVLVPPGEQSGLERILERVREGERVESFETSRMRKDWRRIDVAMTVSPIRDREGGVIGASTIARDISEQKTAERRLSEAARHFELSHELAATCGFDGYFKRLNGAWEPTLGWTNEDLLPNPFIELVHPDDRASVADEVLRLSHGQTTAEFRIRVATKDGGWRWFEWSASPDVEAGLFFCAGRDITERVAAERQLERERRQLADAQEIAKVGSWELDPATGERAWSAQQLRNHGFDPADPPPATEAILERVHPEDREAVRASLAEVADSAKELHLAYRVVLPDGEVRTIESVGRPFKAPDGSLRLMGTSRDVTAERDAERLKDEFFSLVSHELRTPLTSIIGYTELLTEVEAERLTPEGRRFLEVIERNSRRELGLVGDLLLLTRITAGTFEIQLGTADLAEIARAAVEAARPAAEKAQVELSVEGPEELMLAGDRHRLAQVADNLVSNAIKFTPPGGRVGVAVAARGDAVELVVADTGIGISEEDRRRLFERLFRSREVQRRHIQGTGLGLTIARAIVDAHDGEIVVESAPGEGTTFTVTLPALGPRGVADDG